MILEKSSEWLEIFINELVESLLILISFNFPFILDSTKEENYFQLVTWSRFGIEIFILFNMS